ncbi:hypothetical protein, partial [Klebsiella quasipneumoniae]|uniref:hypothetical protein n=1 Tax=Klebsiella quasipneumoniae TaxID=1463165 RepID=UPI001C52CAAA
PSQSTYRFHHKIAGCAPDGHGDQGNIDQCANTFFRHIPSERRGNRIQAIIAGITSLFTQRRGDGSNVFSEKMFRIENYYVRRKEVRILVKFWRVNVLFLRIPLINQE